MRSWMASMIAAGAIGLAAVAPGAMASGKAHEHKEHEHKAHEHKEHDHKEHEHKAHEHKAHEHGVGIMNVALEGPALLIELRAPGADIVGFEHAPSSAEDKKAVRGAVNVLKDGGALFRPAAGAECRLEDAEVQSGLMEEEHGHREHKEHGHNEHGHKEHGHEQEEHAEFHATYKFACAKPGALRHLDLTYFNAFPNARELDARVITARGQSAKELTAASPRLTF